jgi:hypothetical protein
MWLHTLFQSTFLGGIVGLRSLHGGVPLNNEVDPSDEAAIDVLPSMIVKINAVQSPADFTSEYDSAVDKVEERLMGEAFEAMSTLDIDTAAEKLSQAANVRSRYLAILEESANDPQHPLSSSIINLREYALGMENFRQYFQTVLNAFLDYRQGKASDALRLLDRAFNTTVPELDSLLSLQIRLTAENLTGIIRRGVLDYAGARAAFDRATAITQALQTTISDFMESEDDEDESEDDFMVEAMLNGAKFAQLSNEAFSLQMQYAQLMENRDHTSAIDAAREASTKLLEAANLIEPLLPILAPIIRAGSFTALADADIAKGNILLDRAEWDEASDLIKTVRDYYQAASRECLKSKHPSVSMMQEQYLNLGFSWVLRFRRELDRERSHATRVEELQLELRNFYGSVRGALAPTGIVVNNATEMVTSVKQQVEVTNRFEANIRSILREIPDALAATDLPIAERDQLSAEALQLAEDTSDRTGFFTRVGRFSQKVASAISKGAELAAPVVALLKALNVVG